MKLVWVLWIVHYKAYRVNKPKQKQCLVCTSNSMSFAVKSVLDIQKFVLADLSKIIPKEFNIWALSILTK